MSLASWRFVSSQFKIITTLTTVVVIDMVMIILTILLINNLHC